MANHVEVVKQFIIDNTGAMLEHRTRWHYKGVCNEGHSHSVALDTEADLLFLREVLTSSSSRDVDEAVRKRFRREVADALLVVASLPLDDRTRILAEADQEWFRLRKEAGREFARQQASELQALGLSPKEAWRVIRAAGPGRAVAAATWARASLAALLSGGAEEQAAKDLLDCLLLGRGGETGFGWGRMADAIRALGLEPPEARSSSGFFATLAGARVAILAFRPSS